jgi:hypothetical protein
LIFAKDELKMIAALEGIREYVYFAVLIVALATLSFVVARLTSDSKAELAVGSVKWFIIFNLIGFTDFIV